LKFFAQLVTLQLNVGLPLKFEQYFGLLWSS